MIDLLPEKYENIRKLVGGQNASVFSAKDRFLNRIVFLKGYQIPLDDLGSALREPRYLVQLAHENLTRIYAADPLENGYLLLSMEMVTGGSFSDIIDRAEKSGVWPSTNRVLKLVGDAAAGLGHLHLNRFVHRDIKPANLMRREEQTTEQGVVTDLGLASLLNEAGKAYASKHAKLYRPPEIWQGYGYCPSSDVYQLGCVLFQMLGGRMPYELSKLSDEILAKRIVVGKLLDLNTLPPHLPKAFTKIIQKCICDRSLRLKSMCDFTVELNNLRANNANWLYRKTPIEYEVVREDRDGRSYRFSIESSNNFHTILREKKVGNGAYRKNGPPVTVNHVSLANSRRFNELINSSNL